MSLRSLEYCCCRPDDLPDMTITTSGGGGGGRGGDRRGSQRGGDKSWSRGSVMPTPEKQQMQRGGRGGGGGADWSREFSIICSPTSLVLNAKHSSLLHYVQVVKRLLPLAMIVEAAGDAVATGGNRSVTFPRTMATMLRWSRRLIAGNLPKTLLSW